MSFKDIDIMVFKKKMLDKNSTIIDIRDSESFLNSNIPGSKNFDSNDLLELANQENKDQELLIYCYKGHSSRKIAHFFSESGFDKVYSLIGGFESWKNNK